MIRNKLEELLAILTSLLPDIQASADTNMALSTVFQSIEETTDYCNDLGQKCIQHSYSGKLLMQSDLDIILVKFDNYVKSLSEFVNADGFLSS
ncbi:hypothetical protein SSX86_011371 [Deinandra increscens subsp. villosa]|uniref:DUF7032 domain-containing protein n=1 Tax=Deinandra increscens subsp. villosa TaxID=3103831 RepID=A0AAP0DBG0_9ASTR